MYKFCPKCAGILHKKIQSLLVCAKCNFHFYQNPFPTTGAIIVNRENKILLVKRKFPPKKGFWDVPGGFIEGGESTEEALIRELKEELGINIRKFSYLSSYSGKYFYEGINYDILCFMYVVKIEEEKIKIGDDVSGFKCFDSSEVPFKRVAFDFIKRAIEEYLKNPV